ncbi:MAG TPA: hypothetical protein VJA66_03150, partial [Thermoanaerobaculia bacterium]
MPDNTRHSAPRFDTEVTGWVTLRERTIETARRLLRNRRQSLNPKPRLLSASRAEIFRAVEVAADALRTDRTRTRAAVVALALAMAIVVCLTTLVERGRAATIRSLERA